MYCELIVDSKSALWGLFTIRYLDSSDVVLNGLLLSQILVLSLAMTWLLLWLLADISILKQSQLGELLQAVVSCEC